MMQLEPQQPITGEQQQSWSVCDRILAQIALRIRKSLDLDEILNTTVEEVRQFLQTDRVVIYHFFPDWSGMVEVESVAADVMPILGIPIHDPCFENNWAHKYQQGRITAIEDIYTANINLCYIELLKNLQIRANLVVPIIQGEKLWGLLIAHHSRAARLWHKLEIELLQKLATQVAIAIQQSELYHQLQKELKERQQAELALQLANEELEQKVEERTAELQIRNRQLQAEVAERKLAEKKLRESQICLKLINSISNEITPDMLAEQVIAIAVTQISKYFPEFRVLYATIDRLGNLIVTHSIEPAPMLSACGITAKFNHISEYWQALRAGEPVIVFDLKQVNWVASSLNFWCTRKVQAFVNVSVPHTEELIGLLALESPLPQLWSQYKITTIIDVADYLSIRLKEARAQQERKQAEEALNQQHLKSQLFAEITLKIRQSLHLEEILQTTVTEVQKILQVERMLIYRVWSNGTGNVVTEEVLPGWPVILGCSFSEEVFPVHYQKLYSQGRTVAIDNIQDGTPCLVQFLRQWGVKAKLVAPILQNEQLWGLIIAHQCSNPRMWTKFEIELLQQLADQVGIAISQAQLLEALRQSEERYRRIVETAGEGIWVIDANSKTTFVNQKMAEMLGYTAMEMLGKPLLVFMDEESKIVAQSNLQPPYLSSHEERDFKFERKDGTSLWGIFSTTPLLDSENRYIGALVMVTDISDRKQAEAKIKASLEEKEVLLKEIHHRVKNNLQVISSLLKLQSAYIEDPKVLSLFTDSYNRVKSMALIHEKLYQSPNLSLINTADYIPNLANNLLQSYGICSNKINLTVKVDDIFLEVDTAVPCGLIINELVSNSLKYAFTESLNGQICINAYALDELVHLIISDNGVGLPPGFNFRQTESLGLQLVCTLTKQLAGDIQLDCTQGTCYTIKFIPKNIRNK